MKRRVALGALVVLVGVVSLGALLMWGPLGSTPEASATTQSVDLVMGRTEVDVGEVSILGNSKDQTLRVTFTAASGYVLDEVHVCVWPVDTCADAAPRWTPPGRCPYGDDPATGVTQIEVTIPLNGNGLSCGEPMYIQAHAALEGDETAYGDSFKGNFCLVMPCCSW